MVLRLATRGSKLALWQAHHVKARLEAGAGDVRVDVAVVQTTGDRITDVPLARIGDKGLFTKEVDRSLLTHQADLAVHSLKDVPTVLEPGLALGAVLEREDPRDIVVYRDGVLPRIDELPDGARIGTSSLRRRAQLLERRPGLRVEDLRGNLDTRLRRVADGDYDAAILARAGLVRLGRTDAIGQVLEMPGWLPAVGQGALTIAIREDDDATRAALSPLEHDATRAITTAERSFLRRLEGGCQVPIGALATLSDGTLQLHGFVSSLDGSTVLRGEATGPASEADRVGRELAERLIGRGADAILAAVRAHDPGSLPGASPP